MSAFICAAEPLLSSILSTLMPRQWLLQLSRWTPVDALVSHKMPQEVIIWARAKHGTADWHFCHVNMTSYDALQIGFTVQGPPMKWNCSLIKCTFKEIV